MDVCFTVDAFRDPANPVGWYSVLSQQLSGCVVLSKTEADIRFHKVLPNPREHLSLPVLPAHRFDGTAIPIDHPVGRDAMGSTGVHATIGPDLARFEVVRKVPQRTWRLGAIEVRDGLGVDDLFSGAIDGLVHVPLDDRPRVRASDDMMLKSYDLHTIWYVAVRPTGALADVATRQRLDAAIDRLALRSTTQKTFPNDDNPSVEMVSGPFSQSSSMYNRSVKPREHVATDLTGLSLRLGIPAAWHADDPLLLDALAAQWRDQGATIETVVLDGDPMRSIPKAPDVDLLVVRHTDPSHGFEAYRSARFGTGGASNPLGLSSPKVDGLLRRTADATTDTALQDALHDLHETLHAEAHALFLWKRDTKSAWRDGVRNNLINSVEYWTDVASWNMASSN